MPFLSAINSVKALKKHTFNIQMAYIARKCVVLKCAYVTVQPEEVKRLQRKHM